MDGEAILRLVDSLHRDKEIDKEKVFTGIESAIQSAIRKHSKDKDDITVIIDRNTGNIDVHGCDGQIDPSTLGRITAQTAKQVIIQKVREAESVAIFDEFNGRKNTIISGVVRRFEGPNMLIDLGKTEGVLHKSGQIYGEYYHVDERVRTLILDVKMFAGRVKVILSRTHPDFVRRLFEMEVPEITENIIEIKGIARESGHRTKIAVHSNDANIDCVGACVGVRGVRIKGVVNELNGEKIDIVKWSDEPEEMLPNALKPAGVSGLVLSSEGRSASVIVPDDQFSLAIGKKGQNVRLASVLTDWHLDIITESQFEKSGGESSLDSDAENTDDSDGSDDSDKNEDASETGKTCENSEVASEEKEGKKEKEDEKE
ncbi:MAG: transcription termination factor NusA [Candidatus Anammoxibacter sp.]